MVKKASNNKKPAGVAAVAERTADAAAAPQNWEELLESDPVKKAAEEAKQKERQKKAEEAAQQTKKANEKRDWYAQQEKKDALKKKIEDAAWNKEVGQAKQRAFKESVLEAQYDEWAGTYWVEISKGTWREISQQYLCTCCDKQLNDSNLKAHLDSDAHKRKAQYQMSGAASRLISIPTPISERPAAGYPRGPAALSVALASKVVLEEWQEFTADGSGCIRCIPCGKVVDENHLAKADHTSRLELWLHQREIERNGYPAPPLPYLALMPDADLQGPRWPKCLLCNKWCQDETSHTGTHDNPQGSKEHQKNLRNYGPSTAYYQERVTEIRNRWHPPACDPALAAAPAPTAAPEPPLPLGWSSAVDECSGMTYYWQTDGNSEAQWEHRASAEAAAVSPAVQAPSAAAAPAATAGEDGEVVEC